MLTTNDILLIEDSPSQAMRFKLMLNSLGYQVHLASDGREGWQKAHIDHPSLILLDFNLPLLSGLQVLSRLKRDRNTANIPVVMLSEQERAIQVEEALNLGADDYLFKSDYTQENAASSLQCAIEQVLMVAAH